MIIDYKSKLIATRLLMLLIKIINLAIRILVLLKKIINLVRLLTKIINLATRVIILLIVTRCCMLLFFFC